MSDSPGQIPIESTQSAFAAIRKCQPFILPPGKYEAWKVMEITFDPTLAAEAKGGKTYAAIPSVVRSTS